MSKKRDLLGCRFGRLLIIGDAGTHQLKCGQRRAAWLCRCDCGKETVKGSLSLLQGRTKSCGCLKRPHGHGGNAHKRVSASPTYNSWRAMIVRCTSPNGSGFDHYGARGITVCEHWLKFENFLGDMGERTKGTSLDRIENDKGYEPGNCRWATGEEQAANRSITNWITYKGKAYPLMALARIAGCSEQVLRFRLNSGWSVDRAVETPVRKWKRKSANEAAPASSVSPTAPTAS